MSRTSTHSRYTVLDVEHATDARSTVCAVGVAVLEDGKIVFSGEWLVRPAGNRYSFWHTKIHGIQPRDTESAPELREVWDEIRSHLENSVLVGHGIKDDIRSLRAALATQNIALGEFPYVDTVALARSVLTRTGYTGKLGLGALAELLQLNHRPHSAGSDALVNAQLLDYLFSRTADGYGLPRGWQVTGLRHETSAETGA
jgi:DNA polymerase-3 subunit epsilon